MSKHRAFHILSLLVMSYLAFSFLEWRLPFMETTDARYAEVAKNMLEKGDYLVPFSHDVPHLAKPPFTYWFVALGYRIWGINEYGGRFFSFIFSFLTACVLYVTARLLTNNDRKAVTAAIIYVSTPLVIACSRIILTDSYLLFFNGLAMLGFVSAYFTGWRHGYALFWISMGMSNLVKGPLGMIQVLPVVVLFLALTKGKREIISLFRQPSVIVAIILLAAWPVALGFRFDGVFKYFLQDQLLSRVSRGGFGHEQPFYYFLLWTPVVTYPWSILSLRQIGTRLYRHDMDERFLLLLIWLLFPVVLFSLPASKLLPYVLMSTLPMAMLASEMIMNGGDPT